MATRFRDTIIYELCERIIRLKGQENRLFKLVLDRKEIKDLIIEQQTDVQMRDQSVDSMGLSLFNRVTGRSTYAPSDPLGRGGRPYQVFRTGEYYASFEVEVGSGLIRITSDPEKENNNLLEVYGSDLEGLTEESLEKLIIKAHEYYIEWFEKNIFTR